MTAMSVETAKREEGSARAGTTYVSLTYRYLRIGMTMTVLAIFVSVAIQAEHSKWTFLDSLSTYYYTPAQFVFVASLVAIGVCLIVIRGESAWEDGLLNIAGMFAVIVAIVPTPLTGDCFAPPPDTVNSLTPTVENNLLTYLLVGSAVLIGSTIAGGRALLEVSRRETDPDVAKRFFALIPAIVLAIAGWYIYLFAWDFVALCAHPVCALGLFGCFVAVVVTNALGAQGGQRLGYWVIAGLMVAGGTAIVLARGIWSQHWVLILEAAEILLFAAFWIAQTFDAQKQNPPAFDRYPAKPVRG